MPLSLYTTYAGIVLLLSCLISACNAPEQQPSPGETLAREHCASCHVFPEPDLLARTQWASILPDMGGRLGMYTTVSRDSLIRRVDLSGMDPLLIYPMTPALQPDEWQAITAYFLDEAPAAMDVKPRQRRIKTELANFTIRSPRFRFDPPLTTLTHIQDSNRIFFVGNYAETSTLVVINAEGSLLFQWELAGDPVDVHWDNGRLLILLIGKGPEPTEIADGAIVLIDGTEAPIKSLITGLKRPVDMKVEDLNQDGLADIIICEFGNEKGYLSWYEQRPDGSYERHVLSEVAGAVETVLHDFNRDGRMDIAALMAQGDEGVNIYLNDGGGGFTLNQALRFPPVYGSNHIALADFNQDGIQDLLYANGDNADITNTLKPYHGIRIFLGDGGGAFEERFFYPLHGASKAQAADFDGDGDLDIAAIAFFPDYGQTPEESFVMLENNGDMTFEASTFEQSYRGRWLVMDVGDIDGDQDADILLGSNIGFAPENDHQGLFERWMKEGPSFILLENQMRKP